ncbi:MAG: glycosyltransferase family 4 protein [Candidatus Woesearchaeota archaeon]|nr:glycosyltransferase family 4 protein [Candidatus Woesearchaeota archaeon]MDP7181053.1 glycosyltransferase family 4 protein [Candidatus Woesearchaeota archaeon]MDP7198326.1 glycosyltransferase family 4 protein [Candidatus Woesearchaeota archaeon]MDP7467428.1 glycosyltransferase family 4 protein [Candidatus Woesearchaeota archaeon]MDP7647655.1 glycosyltransferase family 4 protein [Candidatus Woesearchaeota archaeon]
MRLNVLKLGWFYHPVVGGVETCMKLLAEELLRQGHTPTVLCSGQGHDVINGVHVIRSPLINPKKSDIKQFETWFGEFLDKNSFDIVHCHNLSLRFNVEKSLAILKACRHRGIPILEHAHNAQLRFARDTKPIISFDFDKILCVSYFVAGKLSTIRDKKDLVVSHNPIDFSFLSHNNVNQDKVMRTLEELKTNCVILFPARPVRIVNGKPVLHPQKKLKHLLDAAKVMKKKGLDFKIVIPGMIGQPGIDKKTALKANKLVQQTIKKLGIVDKVKFLGKTIPLEEMPTMYTACDVVCMPAVNETFGLGYAEGQAMAKAVVATNTGGALEVVKNGRTGFLVEPNNVKDLAAKLEILITDPSLRSEMGEAGRVRVKKLFAKEEVVKKLISTYRKVYMANIIPITLRRINHWVHN